MELTQEILDKLKNIQQTYYGDKEAIHIAADKVIYKYLLKMGFHKIAKEWKKCCHWYA